MLFHAHTHTHTHNVGSERPLFLETVLTVRNLKRQTVEEVFGEIGRTFRQKKLKLLIQLQPWVELGWILWEWAEASLRAVCLRQMVPGVLHSTQPICVRESVSACLETTSPHWLAGVFSNVHFLSKTKWVTVWKMQNAKYLPVVIFTCQVEWFLKK